MSIISNYRGTFTHCSCRTLPAVLKALEPLRSAGYLTTFANGTLTSSAVTVVGTGNSPLEPIKALEPRDIFFDAPLTELSVQTNTTWSPELSPVASTDYATAVGVRPLRLQRCGHLLISFSFLGSVVGYWKYQ